MTRNLSRIIDISQEVFSCQIYPGDPSPQSTRLEDMEQDALYNLSALSMCVHNGTHIDAPAHFIRDGKTIDQLPLEVFVGDCFVTHQQGDLTAKDAHKILDKAAQESAAERILIAGKAIVTAEAAKVFALSGVRLIGVEGTSVGPEDAPMEVHLILLGAEVVLLEGLVLQNVAEGKYFLSALPLNLGGLEGSPCRAYLIQRNVES